LIAKEGDLRGALDGLPEGAPGREMYGLIERLYPICRSITGEGVRRTLDIIAEYLPLERSEVPSGTPVFDWTVPLEWNIRDAYVKDPAGQKIIDFTRNNLHVVSYSVPVHKRCKLAELREHLHADPGHPDWIPYRTSYYQETWGFCLPHRQLERLEEGEYEVCIDSELVPGTLSYGECVIPGESNEEVLLFAHTCHPSLCNDNLSGIALLVQLGRLMLGCRHRFSYRLLFAPATIGSITWLSRNEDILERIRAGLVVSVTGDQGGPTYKRSRRGDALIDRACAHVLATHGEPHRLMPFSPWGYDERQFCSPGIDLPMGRLTRSPNGEFAEYHSSADNLDLVHPECLEDSLRILLRALNVIEGNARFINLYPKGEPQLGRRGLYRMMGGFTSIGDIQHALLWVLNFSDGEHSLLAIGESSGIRFELLQDAAKLAVEAGLLSPVGTGN
jgi:aminopeptidase-like protein